MAVCACAPLTRLARENRQQNYLNTTEMGPFCLLVLSILLSSIVSGGECSKC